MWGRWAQWGKWPKWSSTDEAALSPVTTNLVAEYKFDEGSGQTLGDSSGNGYDLQLGSTSGVDANDPTWGAEGLTFAPSQYCMRNTPEADLRPAAFTVMVVAKTTAATDEVIVGWDVTNPSNGVLFLLTGINTPNIYLNAAQRRAFTSPINLNDGVHHCVTFTMPGSDAADILTSACYVNEAAATAGFTLSGAGSRAKTHFLVGRSGTYYFTGTMAWLLFYNRALTEAEILENYAYLQSSLAGRGITLP